MATINYCIPGSTPYANTELKRIYSIAKTSSDENNITCSLGELNNNCINITYGYLGIFCRLYFNKLEEPSANVANNSYIIDHSYTSKDLKGKIYRLSAMNKDLETQVFNESMVSDKEKDLIYEHLKEKSAEKNIDLLVAKEFAEQIKDDKLKKQKINILIKKSSLQERIKQSAQPLINSWKKKNSTNPNSEMICAAFKPWEMKVDIAGKHRVVNHFGERTNIDIDRIRSVYCPTSMMALDFILKQCPTHISNGHPLYRILGNYIPRLSKKDSIDLAMNCIMKISFSTEKLSILNSYLKEIFH